jgi:outer membrane protein TolC
VKQRVAAARAAALFLVVACATAPVGVHGQSATPEHVRALLAQAAAAAPTSPQPGGTAAGAPGAVDLKLEEAVALALERNLDIAVERLNPQFYDFTIAAFRAIYRPVVTSTIGQNNITQLPTTQLVGGAAVQQDQTTFNFGGGQQLPWGGGSLNVTFNNRRQDSTSSFNTFNPQFNSGLSAFFAQPLLRNFRTDLTRTQLRVSLINRNISELQLKTVVTNTLASVRNAYWDYVYTVDLLNVQQRSLELARKLLEDNRVRVEVGTLAPIDVVQAEAEVANRQQEIAQVEAQMKTAELVLKRLIVSGTDDPRWKSRLNPVDRPAFERTVIDLEGALQAALTRRLDLAQSRQTLAANELNVKYLANQKLPAVDLVASYGLQGIGGPRYVRDESLGGEITGTIPGGYADALRLLRSRDYPQWNAAVTISYPLGTSPAAASYARARVTMRQTEAQIKALELQIATEITNAASQMQSNITRVEAATAAREFAQKRLEAETSKFEVGLSTNFFVVQAQRDLAEAENSELRARLDYQKSKVEFERSQDSSLSNAGISVVSITTNGNVVR